MKLARSISNANAAGSKELSDFGFRIQLGGLHHHQPMTNGGIMSAAPTTPTVGGAARRNSFSGRSESSEELVVDGNDEDDEEAEANEADGASATVGGIGMDFTMIRYT